MARLVINTADAKAFSVELKPGVNHVGRHWTNDVQINDPSVSTRHCEILYEDKEIRVRDLSSTNGTFVNRKPIQEAVLHPGDMLTAGNVNMIMEIPRVRSAPQVAIPPQPAPDTPGPYFLTDGSPACENHRQNEAGWRCTQCDRCFCDACLHQIRRVGGKALQLCPRCSGRCVAIAPAPPLPRMRKQLTKFWNRLFGSRK